MALDGITLNAIIYEISENLIGGKIDKIYQPEKDEIILTIRNRSKNYKLLLSANANYPRMYLTDENKENPAKPPMFCMLMRKYLQGGKITDIRQIDLDRVAKIDVESRDEFENQLVKTIIIEIMGRHSNIILIDKEDRTIIDSIKRVYPDMSKIREVLPGRKYEYPPLQDKLNLLSINKIDFTRYIKSFKNKKIDKALVDILQGISPVLGREIAFRARVNNKYVEELTENELNTLFVEIEHIKDVILNHNYKPCIAYYKGDILDFSCIELKQYDNIVLFDNNNKTAYEFFKEKANVENIKTRAHDLKKIIQIHLDRLYNKIEKQNEEIINAENADIYRIYGELIIANIHMLYKGMENLKTVNYYTNKEVIVPLDKRFSPSDNAQKYFKKYNKAKNAIEILKRQIEETKIEIEYLEGQLVNLEQCTLPSEIEEVKEELTEEGYIKKHIQKSKQKKAPSKPLHFISKDGYDIYIGKNNIQNEYLTMKFASPNDIWLHTKNIPGSHIIIKNINNNIPETTLIEAAKLAAAHSKAKDSSNVPVDFTYRKYVKKPSGSKPGFVIYTNQKTLYVTPSNKQD